MRLGSLVLLLALMFPSAARSQRVASVDLTAAVATEHTPRNKAEQQLPPGCKELLPGAIADGYVFPKGHSPQEISVSVVNVTTANPREGNSIRALVRLRNESRQPVQLPWSREPDRATAGQDLSRTFRDAGTFEFELQSRDNSHRRYALISQTWWLYGSTSAPDTLFVLRPGEWIDATVAFKLVNQYFPNDRLPVGQARLVVEWHQVQKTWTIHNCTESVSYYYYTGELGEGFYKQTNPGFEIRIDPSSQKDTRK